ncbi:MAG TPA: DUF4388 domain-containing protein [Frankiaceae bacterium]|nr:DUF4388 domain-containing protein [Frankiaceae bacterium]
MRLEGTLDAFGLPDILQLLAFTRKTGVLQLKAPPAAGLVRVRDGAICAASSDSSREMLARRVVGAGLVGDDALQSAVRTAIAGERGVVAALLAGGALDVDAVVALSAEQATDAVGELLRWTSGEFSFVVEDDPDALPLQLAVDEVVAEGQRRLAVWAELTAVIPSADIALALAVAPAEEPRCSREEWGLLALVDGSRTVAEMVALLGRSEFGVMRSLAALVSRGLLVVPGASGPGGGFAELERRQAMLAALETGSGPFEPEPEPELESESEPQQVPTARGTEPSWSAAGPVESPKPTPMPAPAPRYEPAPSNAPVSVTASSSHPATLGSSALAPDLNDSPPIRTAPIEDIRPALTLAMGPHDAPVSRSLLVHLPPPDAN